MNINNALHNIQTELKAPKGQTNNFGKYKYRSCEDIVEAVKKVLPEGMALTLSDEMVMLGDRFYVKAQALLFGEGCQVISYGYAREAQTKKGMDEAQVTGAASSYARKYALNGLFAIDDTKDADTDEHRKNKQEAEKAATKQEAEDKRNKAEAWVTGYLLKLTDIEDVDRQLMPLQSENTAMLKRISVGYPLLHKSITTKTDEVRGHIPSPSQLPQ